jgi:coenzyme F420-0:L-glutamate ligase/coenzyme F420-1:gamma-L-glutamate ligase
VTRTLTLRTLDGIPLVRPGDDLATLLLDAAGDDLRDGDVLVVAQKIFSKAHNRYVALSTVTPSAEAVKLAEETEKDPRAVELVLRESREVLRKRVGVIIVVHKLGMVMANAGIDASNVERAADGEERVLLLPEDPDHDCAHLRGEIRARRGIDVAVIMNDSVGRAWRSGTVGIAIGAAGLPSLVDLRGQPDMFGRTMQSSIVAMADELAAAASVLQGQAAEASPAVVIRGVDLTVAPEMPAKGLIRDVSEDLFR